MELPIPPTDSVYKFLCVAAMLGGLSLFIWTSKQVTDLETRQAELRRRLAVTGEEVKSLQDDFDLLRYQIEQTKKAGQEAVKHEISFLDDATNKLRERRRVMAVKNAEIAADSIKLQRLIREIAGDTRLGTFQIFAFLGLFAASLASWYTKIQVHQDRVLRAQADAAEAALMRDAADTSPRNAKRGRPVEAPPEGTTRDG
jgi:cell fate (sporulation/competence/biofilm development) regulator YlbF (YheA/YmcA/DUF963 family)